MYLTLDLQPLRAKSKEDHLALSKRAPLGMNDFNLTATLGGEW